VNSCSRSLYVVVRPSVCRLSSVCLSVCPPGKTYIGAIYGRYRTAIVLYRRYSAKTIIIRYRGVVALSDVRYRKMEYYS